MSFYASNDRIWITDTDGTLVFDTNNDMPSIIGVYETNLSKTFTEQYYTEEYQTVASLPDRCDFVICRASCTPTNLSTGTVGQNSFEKVYGYTVPWVNACATGNTFFQGSMILETGQTAVQYSVAQYARRALHVYPAPSWGNKLMALFQQGVKSGYGAVPTTQTVYRNADGSLYTGGYPFPAGVWVDQNYPGPAQVKWDVNLKVWVGRFR